MEANLQPGKKANGQHHEQEKLEVAKADDTDASSKLYQNAHHNSAENIQNNNNHQNILEIENDNQIATGTSEQNERIENIPSLLTPSPFTLKKNDEQNSNKYISTQNLQEIAIKYSEGKMRTKVNSRKDTITKQKYKKQYTPTKVLDFLQSADPFLGGKPKRSTELINMPTSTNEPSNMKIDFGNTTKMQKESCEFDTNTQNNILNTLTTTPIVPSTKKLKTMSTNQVEITKESIGIMKKPIDNESHKPKRKENRKTDTKQNNINEDTLTAQQLKYKIKWLENKLSMTIHTVDMLEKSHKELRARLQNANDSINILQDIVDNNNNNNIKNNIVKSTVFPSTEHDESNIKVSQDQTKVRDDNIDMMKGQDLNNGIINRNIIKPRQTWANIVAKETNFKYLPEPIKQKTIVMKNMLVKNGCITNSTPTIVALYFKNIKRCRIGALREALRQTLPSWAVLGLSFIGGSILEVLCDVNLQKRLIHTMRLVNIRHIDGFDILKDGMKKRSQNQGDKVSNLDAAVKRLERCLNTSRNNAASEWYRQKLQHCRKAINSQTDTEHKNQTAIKPDTKTSNPEWTIVGQKKVSHLAAQNEITIPKIRMQKIDSTPIEDNSPKFTDPVIQNTESDHKNQNHEDDDWLMEIDDDIKQIQPLELSNQKPDVQESSDHSDRSVSI